PDRRPADGRRRVGVDVDGVHRLPRLPVVPLQGVLRGLLRRRLPCAPRRLLGHRPAGAAHHLPQLGPPDPPADLLRLPDGPRCVGTWPGWVRHAPCRPWWPTVRTRSTSSPGHPAGSSTARSTSTASASAGTSTAHIPFATGGPSRSGQTRRSL